MKILLRLWAQKDFKVCSKAWYRKSFSPLCMHAKNMAFHSLSSDSSMKFHWLLFIAMVLTDGRNHCTIRLHCHTPCDRRLLFPKYCQSASKKKAKSAITILHYIKNVWLLVNISMRVCLCRYFFVWMCGCKHINDPVLGEQRVAGTCFNCPVFLWNTWKIKQILIKKKTWTLINSKTAMCTLNLLWGK